MKLINDIKKLDKPIYDYKIKSSKELNKYEKEVHVSLRDDGVYFHSDKKTGIRWAIELLNFNDAKFVRLYLEENAIVSICIITSCNFISFKSKKRKSSGVSNCFSMPSNYKKAEKYFNNN
jgi:hypothetical protein